MRPISTAFIIAILTLGSSAATAQGPGKPRTATPVRATRPATTARTVVTDAELTEAVHKNCAVCHNDKSKSQYANVTLEHYDVAAAAKDPELSERMIRKVRAGMMPPPNGPKPPAATLVALAERIESKVDAAAKLDPNPGSRSFQRLNRAEYKAAIKDLLGLDIDPGNWLPLDTMSGNFDNIADAQFLNPTVLEAYLNAAEDISRMAIGDRNAADISVKYANSTYLSQNPGDHVPGTPYGTRGGIAVDHVFPADGDAAAGS